MLPLWIIDITTNDSRRKSFLNLLKKVENVYIPEEFLSILDQDTTEVTHSLEQVTPEISISSRRNEIKSILDKTVEERRKEEEKRLAIKESIIKGNYWYYSAFDDPFREIDVDEHPIENEVGENEEDTQKGIAQLTYELQEQIVKAGKEFVAQLRRSNVRPYQTINIIVLGDATEQFTQMLFPAMAIILQKEKGRFMPAHIHQGICIYGSLYIPCDINTYEVKRRAAVLHLIDEIEVQNQLDKVRGYDHMMLYQNVQNRTECHYPLLDDKQLSEYLIQCLVHLFLACDVNHPLISGTMSDEMLYFSMGAASVYFDMNVEDAQEANMVAAELVAQFKKKITEEVDDREEIRLLDEDLYKASNIVREFTTVDKLDLTSIDMGKPSPHPILDMMHKQLKRLYYNTWLRLFPLRMLQKIADYIEKNTSDRLNKVSASCSNAIRSLENGVPEAIGRVLSKVNPSEGALSALEHLFGNVESMLSKQHEQVNQEIENTLWETIRNPKTGNIPKDQEDYFDEYHGVYRNDVETKNNGNGQAEMKSQALEKLTQLLSTEPTALAVITRSILLGIMCVLGLMPLFYAFNIGEGIGLGAETHVALWSGILFLLPFTIGLIQLLLYIRKLNQIQRVLRAYFIHDAYARLANRVETEANRFYKHALNLCKEYLDRCEKIRQDIRYEIPGPEYKTRFPKSMFNCQLNGGVISDEEIIPQEEVERCRIRVNYTPISISELDTSHYYIMLNSFKETFAGLFRDVKVYDNSVRRMDPITQQEVYISKEQLEKETEENWSSIRQEFLTKLVKNIHEELLPREYPTVGEKLRQYMRKTENYHLLEPLFEYAAVNGEIVCDSDIELIDIKVNQAVDELFDELPISHKNVQEILYDGLYEHYLFVTRWKCFSKFSLNRILPTEDFDANAREELNYVAEQEAKKKEAEKRKEQERRRYNKMVEESEEVKEAKDVKEEYTRDVSALILWAVCPDDKSNLWMKFFNSNFSKAIEDRSKIREVMNQDD